METLMNNDIIDNYHQSNIICISFIQNKTLINVQNVYSVDCRMNIINCISIKYCKSAIIILFRTKYIMFLKITSQMT